MKSFLKKAISKSTDLFGIELLIALSNRHLLLPFYHTISDRDLAHIKHLYPIQSTSRFQKDLNFLLKNFKPVSYAHLLKNTTPGNKISGNCFFLSFDDGLREFYEVVAPILLDRGIPATCFVNSAFIDNKDMFYRLKASVLIEKINHRMLSAGQEKKLVDIFKQYQLTYNSATDLLKITYQNKEILDNIAPFVEVSFTDYLSEQQPYLTTNQIKELIQNGFSFGSHSVSHPYYNFLTEDNQVQETLDCLNYLILNFNIKERLFSFPYTDSGVTKSFFSRVDQDVELSFGTASLKQDIIPTNFQRTPMEVSGFESAENIIKSEYLYYILKRLAGKHIINRT